MGSVLPILNGVRQIVARHVVADVPITSDISPGDTVLNIKTTIRLKNGDEIIITDGENEEHDLFIHSVIDDTHIQLTTTTRFDWAVSDNVVIKRAFAGQYVKGIYLGEPDVIPTYPAITVNIVNSHSEFWTTRATKERYQIEIGIFVEGSDQESGATLLWELTDRVQLSLKKNVYPLLSDFTTYNITADIQPTDYFIKVADTSVFRQGQLVLIEDTFQTVETYIDVICDATTLKLNTPTGLNYSTADTLLILPTRFIFNSWPADITWGKIFKGTLLKGASISWFAEEMEIQFNKPWTDTQLT